MPISSQAVAAFHQFVADAICGASRRMNSRPARASSIRRSTWVPKYGAGLGLRTVAWISCKSSVGACAERLSPTDSLTDNMGAFLSSVRADSGPDPGNDWPLRLSNLVEEFFNRLTRALHACGLRHRQIRMGDKPAFCGDLVRDDPILDLRAANPGPAFQRREDHVHFIRNLRCEVVDIGIPLAVVGRREQKLRVVVEEDEALVMERADLFCGAEVAVQESQQRAQPLGAAGRERGDEGQLGDLALANSDPASAFALRCARFCQQLLQRWERVLQRRFRELGRVSEKLPQLLNLRLDGQVLFWPIHCCCLRGHSCFLLSVSVLFDARCQFVTQPILSSSSSTALPTRSSLCASATDRLGLETYQASAVSWWLTSQSLITGLRIPGHPLQLQNRMSIEFGIFVTKSSM